MRSGIRLSTLDNLAKESFTKHSAHFCRILPNLMFLCLVQFYSARNHYNIKIILNGQRTCTRLSSYFIGCLCRPVCKYNLERSESKIKLLQIAVIDVFCIITYTTCPPVFEHSGWIFNTTGQGIHFGKVQQNYLVGTSGLGENGLNWTYVDGLHSFSERCLVQRHDPEFMPSKMVNVPRLGQCQDLRLFALLQCLPVALAKNTHNDIMTWHPVLYIFPNLNSCCYQSCLSC